MHLVARLERCGPHSVAARTVGTVADPWLTASAVATSGLRRTPSHRVFVTRPPAPLPCTCDKSTPCSLAKRRTRARINATRQLRRRHRRPQRRRRTRGAPAVPTPAATATSVPEGVAERSPAAVPVSTGSAPSTSMTASGVPTETVAPSSTRISTRPLHTRRRNFGIYFVRDNFYDDSKRPTASPGALSHDRRAFDDTFP